jgi:predicted flap endonuclease-1-like 5' DNA nuclease
VAEEAPPATPARTAAAERRRSRPARDVRDDLKLIYGIGPVIERMLHKIGITQFRQIALWSRADIERIDAQLENFHGRIVRDRWVRGAREQHFRKYGERL